MTRYVAFLRAVNAPGHARTRMSDVRDVFVAAGGANVTTYIQSGNVVFGSLSCDMPEVVRTAKQKLKNMLGEEPEIMVRKMQRLASIVGDSPFAEYPMNSRWKFYVVFLSARPRRKMAIPFVSTAESLEAVGIDGREVFLISRPKKNGFYGFPNNFVEKELGITATSRNWSTITRLVQRDAH